MRYSVYVYSTLRIEIDKEKPDPYPAITGSGSDVIKYRNKVLFCSNILEKNREKVRRKQIFEILDLNPEFINSIIIIRLDPTIYTMSACYITANTVALETENFGSGSIQNSQNRN